VSAKPPKDDPTGRSERSDFPLPKPETGTDRDLHIPAYIRRSPREDIAGVDLEGNLDPDRGKDRPKPK
jgi:hypothetical protein